MREVKESGGPEEEEGDEGAKAEGTILRTKSKKSKKKKEKSETAEEGGDGAGRDAAQARGCAPQ